MVSTYNITLYGVELTIQGEYCKGEERTHDYPGSPDAFEIQKVYSEADISDLLDYFGNKSVLEQLEEQILEKHYR